MQPGSALPGSFYLNQATRHFLRSADRGSSGWPVAHPLERELCEATGNTLGCIRLNGVANLNGPSTFTERQNISTA
jgi:hypothetical protein